MLSDIGEEILWWQKEATQEKKLETERSWQRNDRNWSGNPWEVLKETVTYLADIKDSASFCYCAYVLRISGFKFLKEFAHLYNNIFARFITVEKADLSKGYQNPKKKIGGNHTFFRDNWT